MKALELILCFVVSAIYWFSILYLITKLNWHWAWIFFGAFLTFMMMSFYKIQFTNNPKNNTNEDIKLPNEGKINDWK